jgi:membrane protein DedA with SNARE-associated domain
MHDDDALWVRIRLRIERGKRGEWDDEETALFEGDEPEPTTWVATPLPKAGAYVVEYGHIMADVEHLLLQDQFLVVGEEQVQLTSTIRLEGHPFHQYAEHLLKGGFAGRGAHRFLNLLVKQAHEVVDIYQDPKLRREFAHAVRHPKLLTPKQQRSLLFLVLLTSVWVWVAGLTVLAIVAPNASVGYNLLFTMYFAALSTNLFIPIPVEPLVLASVGSVGTVPAVLASGLGKAVGAWIIYTLGPVLRKGVAALEAKSPLTRKVMIRAEAFARRFGYAALGSMLALPFSPFDIIPVYLFSGLGLRLGPFLAAVFIGFSLRLFLVVLLGEALFGL